MRRENYLIVRIDHVLVPSVVAYVGHGETPYDLNLRFTPFRDSATRYSNKRDAVRDAKRVAGNMPRYQFKVNGEFTHQTVWSNR
jgi:hypothetical protein